MWLAERVQFSKQGENHRCYVEYAFWKVFKKFCETIKKSIFSNAAEFSH